MKNPNAHDFSTVDQTDIDILASALPKNGKERMRVLKPLNKIIDENKRLKEEIAELKETLANNTRVACRERMDTQIASSKRWAAVVRSHVNGGDESHSIPIDTEGIRRMEQAKVVAEMIAESERNKKEVN